MVKLTNVNSPGELVVSSKFFDHLAGKKNLIKRNHCWPEWLAIAMVGKVQMSKNKTKCFLNLKINFEKKFLMH